MAIAIAAFAAAAYIVYKNWDTIGPLVEAVFNRIRDALQPLIEQVQVFITTALERLRAWWATNGPAISQAAETVFNKVAALCLWLTDNVLPYAVAAWENIFKVFVGLLSYVGEQFGSFIMLIVNLINHDWSAAWGNARDIVNTAWEAIKGIVTGALNSIFSVHVSILNSIYSVIQSVWSSIRSYISGILDGVSSDTSGTWNRILGIITGVLNSIYSAISGALSKITSLWSSQFDGLSSIASRAMNAVAGVISGSGSSLASAAASAGQKALDAMSSKLNQMQEMYATIKGIIDQTKKLQSGSGSSGGGSSSGSSSGSSGSSGSTGIKRQGKDGTGEDKVKIREAHATGGIAGYTGWHWMEEGELAIPQQTNWDKLLVQPIVNALRAPPQNVSYGGNSVTIEHMTLSKDYDFEKMMTDIERYNTQKRIQRGVVL